MLSVFAGSFLILLVLQPLAVQPRPIEQARPLMTELKQYLNKFGYLTTFDDDAKLEGAMRLYQAMNHLEVTGVLDRRTIIDMEVPRCGVPDLLINNEPKPKWEASQTHVTYTFHSTGSANVETQALRSACAQAFQKWASISHFTFKEAPEGTSADIEIGFHRDSHMFDGPGKVSAYAYVTPTKKGYMLFDADENWSSGFPESEDELDLETVALHEIGDLLGLKHSFHRDAVMNSHFMPGTTKRELHNDDVNSFLDLYAI